MSLQACKAGGKVRCRHSPARQPCIGIAPRPGRMEQPSVTRRDAGTDSADGAAGRDSPGWFQTSRLKMQEKGLGETLGKALWRRRQQLPGLAEVGGTQGRAPGDAPAGWVLDGGVGGVPLGWRMGSRSKPVPRCRTWSTLAAPGLFPAISNSSCSPWEGAPTARLHHSSGPWASKRTELFLRRAVGCSSPNLNALHGPKSFIFSLKPAKSHCPCSGGVSEIIEFARSLCKSSEKRTLIHLHP